MRILFYGPTNDPARWQAALSQSIPGAEVRIWQEGDDAAADYAIVWKPPPHILLPSQESQAPRQGLKAIFNMGAGVDAILKLGDSLPPGIPLIRLEDAGMGMQMAEYVMHAVLRYFRRFDEFERLSREEQWHDLPPYDKSEFSIGILGLGVLGQRIAAALTQFGFPLRGWSRSPKDFPGIQCFSGEDGFDACLQHSRVLVCVLPLTPDTHGILCRSSLAKLPKGAFLINVARGAHVVEADLLEMVQDAHIAAATLDVCVEEPPPSAHPFWHEPRITLTPHIAAMTLVDDSVRQIAGKIAALERGEAVAGVVDRTKGY